MVERLLGLTRIVPDLAAATEAWRDSQGAFDYVTLTGELLSRHGVYTGGSGNGSGKAPASILGRKNQIAELHGALLQIQEQVNKVSRHKGAIGEERVSSSLVRRCLRAGQLKQVAELLGRPYSLAGTVQPGDRLGRQFGFPTANLDVRGLELPPFGVYAARALVRGDLRPAVLNVGVRPTLRSDAPELRFEVHLLDFDGNLYGQELEVTFVARLRPEQKFSGPDALKAQIAQDAAAARAVLTA